ncbi:pentatricopeptide repeat-containing protein At1g15510, chloroplastic-like [Durio zibethinus]|uniref:Pentatricopeptide repeat-containing protein At1g15510, chloroplastic-like n=1 Tax=Durio zibethinus TaxID=66656 RepID=A0A6P5ZVG6_DURZI|nr:pentatricopeptide repeat-containing protein At1g15510, chloroplastic-like [Durio zibethinus]
MQKLQNQLDEDVAIAMVRLCEWKRAFEKRTYGVVPNLEGGTEVQVHVIRFGFETGVDVFNALVTMYVNCGDLARAMVLVIQI